MGPQGTYTGEASLTHPLFGRKPLVKEIGQKQHKFIGYEALCHPLVVYLKTLAVFLLSILPLVFSKLPGTLTPLTLAIFLFPQY